MSKKKKRDVRAFPGQRRPTPAPGMPPGAPGAPPGPVVRQKITEIDGLKHRLAVQKEQTLIAKQNEITRYRELLAREEENLKLRIALLQMENARDIGHLNLQQGDKVIQEDDEWFIERAPRPGPVPQIGERPLPPAPKVPDKKDLPPPPTVEPEEEEEGEEDSEDEGSEE